MEAEQTEVFGEDDCCTSRFSKASAKGEVVGDEWRCPRCGSLWRGRMMPESSIRRWTADPEIEILAR